MCLALPVLSCALTTVATSATSSSSRLGCPSSVVGVVAKLNVTRRPSKTRGVAAKCPLEDDAKAPFQTCFSATTTLSLWVRVVSSVSAFRPRGTLGVSLTPDC